MAVTSSGSVSVPPTVTTASSGVTGPAPVGGVSGGAGGSGASSSRVGSSVGASSSRAGGSSLGSSWVGGVGLPPPTTSGSDVSMGVLAALISRAVTEGMVAAGAVGSSSPSPVVSAPSPAPSRPTPPVGSVPSPSLPTTVAGSGAPVPAPSSHPHTSGESHNNCSVPRVFSSISRFLWPPCVRAEAWPSGALVFPLESRGCCGKRERRGSRVRGERGTGGKSRIRG